MYYISETAEVWINFILLFCSTCRLSSNSGQKNIYTFCIQSCLLRPTLRCEEKKKDYLFLGGYQKKKLLWQEECTFETFFKDFLVQNGFHMTSNIKTSNHHRAIFWWNYVHNFSTKVVLIWEIAANTDFQFVAGQHLNLKMQILTTKMITLKFKKIQWSIKTHFDGQNHNKIEFQNSNFWQETI